MPHVDNPPTTHYPGCWTIPGHHACALAQINDLEVTMMQLANRLTTSLDNANGLQGQLDHYQALATRAENHGYASLSAFVQDALDALHILDESYIEHPDPPTLTNTVTGLLHIYQHVYAWQRIPPGTSVNPWQTVTVAEVIGFNPDGDWTDPVVVPADRPFWLGGNERTIWFWRPWEFPSLDA